jgi:hypothetical protein
VRGDFVLEPILMNVRRLLALVLLASCAAPTPKVCEPGSTQACSNPGLCVGAQRCLVNGTGWDTCSCAQSGNGGGAATGGGSATGGGTATGGGVATGGGAATGGGVATGGGAATGGGGGTQADAGVCIAHCAVDSDCQLTCAPVSSGSNCCDVPSGICFVSVDPVCPVSSTDGGMGPY